MPHRDWKFRIQDILDAVGAVQKYTQGMEFKTFTEDRRTVDAVVRNLIIIGEAAVQVPEDVCRKYPEIPWYEMRGMRNFVVHEYFRAREGVKSALDSWLSFTRVKSRLDPFTIISIVCGMDFWRAYGRFPPGVKANN